jgi:hypothetical protein
MKENHQMKRIFGIALAATGLLASTASAQNALLNGGFEEKCTPAAGWTAFGNVTNINFYTTSGARSIKMFGPFNAPLGYSGIFQDRPASPGQVYTGSAFVFSPCWDRLRPDGTRALVDVSFIDANGNVINDPQTNISPRVTESTAPGGNAGCDIGFSEPLAVLLTTTPAVAPAGTVAVRIQLLVEQENYIGGAAWWDDASLELSSNPGVNVLENSSFEQAPANCFGSNFVGWVNFGNGSDTPGVNARTGNEAAKLFGGFNGNPAYSGWFQDVAATPGSSWIARGWGRSWVNDSLQPGNNVFLQLEFYDEFGNNLIGPVGLSESIPTPGDDTYRFYETGLAVAPPDTAKVRLVIIQVQSNFAGGATWWDDMELTNGCAADFNGDNFLDFFDYDDYVNCFETGNCPPGKTADFNGDAFVDFFDYDDYVEAFETGC